MNGGNERTNVKNLIKTAFGSIGTMTDPEEEREHVARLRRLKLTRGNRCWIELPDAAKLMPTRFGIVEDSIGRKFTIFRGAPELNTQKVLYYLVQDDGDRITYYEPLGR